MNHDWDIPLVCSVLTGRRLQHWRRGSKNGKLFFDGFSFCIMAEASQYRPIPELDLSGPAHVVAERWRRWKRSFDLYIAGQDIDDATRKHSLLLHYAGMNVQDLFETLTEPAQPEDRYAKTIAMLDGQFKVAKNTPFERHVFRQMCPEANEPIDKFVARLRQQARLCEYSDLDDQLRDQLLDKIAQPGLRRKLLEKEDMTLDDALKICRSWEATAHQTAQMSSSATSSAPYNHCTRRSPLESTTPPEMESTSYSPAPWGTGMPELWIRGTQGRPILPSQRRNLPQMRQKESYQPEVPVRPKYRTDQLITITAIATTSATVQVVHTTSPTEITRERTATTSKQSLRWDRP